MNKLNIVLAGFASLLLISCGISNDEKNRVAAVTCSIIKETKAYQSSDRMKFVNEAREEIKASPFLGGDDEIQRSIQFDTCELLIKDSDDYIKITNSNEKKYLAQVEKARLDKIAEEKRVAEKLKAEAERLAAEKKAETERLAAEKKAEEERRKAALLAEYQEKKHSIDQQAIQACKELKLAESAIFVAETLGKYISKSEQKEMKAKPLIKAGVDEDWTENLTAAISIRNSVDEIKKAGKNIKMVNCADEILPQSCSLIVQMGILYKYFPDEKLSEYKKINDGVKECNTLR